MKICEKIITNVQVNGFGLSELSLTQKVEKQLGKTLQVLGDKGYLLGFAESCTGGLLSSLITKQSGVSDFFWGSVVSYSNESKSLFLGVDPEVFKKSGAVSTTCAMAMSEGLLKKISETTPKKVLTVALTGIAGPTGGSDLKPIGTVFIAVSGTNKASQVFHHEFVIKKDLSLKDSTQKSLSDRENIQFAAALQAFVHIEKYIE